MSDKLKDYVRAHREEFDTLEPPDLWPGISAGLKSSSSFTAKIIKMIGRYGFGLSVLAAATLAGTQYFNNKAQVREEAPMQISLPTSRSVKAPEPQVPPPPPEMEESLPPPVPPEPDRGTVPVAPPLPPESPEMPEVPYETEAGSDFLLPLVSAGARTELDTFFEGIADLEVKGMLCKVRLTGNNGTKLAVKGHVTSDGANRVSCGTTGWKDKDFTIRHERSGNKLKVWIDVVELDKKVKTESTGKDMSVLEFTVPQGVLVNVANSSGDIVAEDLKADSISLSASFGNIRLSDIAARLKLSTSSGNISASGLTGDVKAGTSFGHQHYTAMKGNLRASSSSGNITVEKLNGNAWTSTSFGHHKYSEVEGAIEVASNSGNISVIGHTGSCQAKSSFGHQTFEKVHGDITANAKSGNIKLSETSGRLTLETSFGNIRGEDLSLSGDSEFRSSSGNIRVQLKNPLKELRFELSASNGRLLIEKDNTVNKSEKSLQYGEGKILVRGVSSFGNQSYQ
jgi:hypothetical protein